MYEIIRLKQGIFIILLIISFISCSSSSNDYPIGITNESGIKVVMNPDYPKFKISEVILEEVLSIGEEEGDMNNTFYRLYDINIDNKGNIYTLDSGDKMIRIFDKDGNFKNIFGRVGQGPGEFEYPSRIFIDSKGIIYIQDTGNASRVTRFSSENKYIDDFKIGIVEGLIGIDNEDNLYLTNRLSLDTPTGKEERSFERIDKNGEVLNTITTLEGQSGTRNPVRSGLWRTGYEHGAINYALRKNGDLIVGTSDKYMFSVYDKSGKLKLKFGRKYDPISLTEADISRLTQDPEERKLLPSKKPAFKISYYRFLIDDENNFWVMTFERENEGMTFDVFDEEGIYIRKVFFEFANHKLTPILFNNGILYAIHIDEDGFNRVKGYKLNYISP